MIVYYGYMYVAIPRMPVNLNLLVLKSLRTSGKEDFRDRKICMSIPNTTDDRGGKLHSYLTPFLSL